jgi:hypothetical protein
MIISHWLHSMSISSFYSPLKPTAKAHHAMQRQRAGCNVSPACCRRAARLPVVRATAASQQQQQQQVAEEGSAASLDFARRGKHKSSAHSKTPTDHNQVLAQVAALLQPCQALPSFSGRLIVIGI